MFIIYNHSNEYAVTSISGIFFQNENYKKVDAPKNAGMTVESLIEGGRFISNIYMDGVLCASNTEDRGWQDDSYLIKLSLFKAFKKISDAPTPWGVLTGLRPTKIISALLDEGKNFDETRNIFLDHYLVEEKKFRLAWSIIKYQENINLMNTPRSKNRGGIAGADSISARTGSNAVFSLQTALCKALWKAQNNNISAASNKKSTSKRAINESPQSPAAHLYFNVPYCPSRCLYCSFTSYDVNKYKNTVDSYFDCLEKEIKQTKHMLDVKKIGSVYIGGGTPSSVSGAQLTRLLGMIRANFDFDCEFSVECGRPDTITAEKLRILQNSMVTRISINPQTAHDDVLKKIGRTHTFYDFEQAFALARNFSFIINTDLIVGLIDENESHIENTLNKICAIKPENITTHTLAVKRASALKTRLSSCAASQNTALMLGLAYDILRKNDYLPYYMYRQKNMAGNLENVGFCKPGRHCVFNIETIEEKQSIYAFGCGAISKIIFPEQNRIERIFNFKSVEDYIARIDQVIAKKINFPK